MADQWHAWWLTAKQEQSRQELGVGRLRFQSLFLNLDRSLTPLFHPSHPYPYPSQVLSDRYYPIVPSYNETRSGVSLAVDGTDFTPEELVAMVLQHAKDITAAFGVDKVKDVVLTVPSFFTQHERRALLDAALLANLNVLAMIDENTAAALHFGIDRIDEEAKNVVFYNMGASALQVSVVKYHSYEKMESKFSKKGKTVGSFEVLGKASDPTLGGLAFDARIVDHMAEEFNGIWDKARGDGQKKDVREIPRAMAKLRVQANKVKHVLSANSDFPIFIDALHDDVNYESHLSRSSFNEICKDLLDRATAPITEALAAANVTLDGVDMIELIGGGMRVPRVQEAISSVLGEDLQLGMHINSDESMALGAAFHGANVSTAFRVRHVGMTDINPFPIHVDLVNLEEEEGQEEDWSKSTTLFKANGKVGVKKTIAFTHDSDILCGVDYEESDALPASTELSIERYNVTGVAEFAKEMAEKDLAKPKVSLQFELSTSGIASLIKAEAIVEENVTVTEEIEVEIEDEDDEKDAEETDGAEEGEAEDETADEKAEEKEDDEAKTADDKAEEEEDDKAEADDKAEDDRDNASKGKEKKKKKKKTKTETVEKIKKKIHRRSLKVSAFHVGRIRPYSTQVMADSVAKLAELTRKDDERIALDEAKNKVESYIYHIKNKLIDDEENIAKITTEAQREEVRKLSEDAEEWMYDDGYTADLATFEAKYAEISEPMEKIKFRLAEAEARPEAIKALNKKLGKVEDLIAKWVEEKPQVTEEEREDVLSKIEEVRKWISDNEEKQASTDPSEDPAFLSADVPLQTISIEKLVTKLSKKPKPKPPKEEKKEEAEGDAEGEEEENDDAENLDEEKGEGGGEENNEADASTDDSESTDTGETGEEL